MCPPISVLVVTIAFGFGLCRPHFRVIRELFISYPFRDWVGLDDVFGKVLLDEPFHVAGVNDLATVAAIDHIHSFGSFALWGEYLP